MGFGSNEAVYWARVVKQDWPELELKINGKPYKGVRDISELMSQSLPLDIGHRLGP